MPYKVTYSQVLRIRTWTGPLLCLPQCPQFKVQNKGARREDDLAATSITPLIVRVDLIDLAG